MKNKTLLILAAGLGSRYGGLKQMEAIGPNGEFIIDYSIYDAVRCGFNKIVFVIKEENYQLFLDTITKRIKKTLDANNVEIEYVFQNLKNIPEGYIVPPQRIKPLGTAHAILCAKDAIKEPFIIINSDDFYGYNAFKAISDYLDNQKNNYPGLVGYDVKNTLTEFGSVKRGVCNIKDNKLDSIIESNINKEEDSIIATPIDGSPSFHISNDTKVSMSLVAFYPEFINYIEENFTYFLDHADLMKDEYLMPSILSKGIAEKKYEVNIIDTDEKWVGVTYKEDKESVIKYILYLIEEGRYPKNLWN